MPCQIITDPASNNVVIICGPPKGIHRRHILHCPVDKRRTRFVETFDGAWYGSTFHCVACGDRWADGEMYPRPSERGWRDKARQRARDLWDTAMTPKDYKARVRAEIAYALDYEGGESDSLVQGR